MFLIVAFSCYSVNDNSKRMLEHRAKVLEAKLSRLSGEPTYTVGEVRSRATLTIKPSRARIAATQIHQHTVIRAK